MKEKIDFEIFGGFIVMEMTENHLDRIMNSINIGESSKINVRINNILKYLDNENKTEKKLIINVRIYFVVIYQI